MPTRTWCAGSAGPGWPASATGTPAARGANQMGDAILAAAAETLELWAGGELDYPDLAEDIAIEARLALQLTEEIKDLDERTALLLNHADPQGILTSAPGVAHITAAAILGRLGDPTRFTSLAGVRAFTGLVPTLNASGLTGRHGGPTKRGDAVLRQALFMSFAGPFRCGVGLAGPSGWCTALR